MKIALSSTGQDLDAQIDPRFGRCAFFLIVDPDDMSFKAFKNENANLSGGAGIQSAQFVSSKGAEVVITGNVGPNAYKTLSAAGVKLITGQLDTVREAIEKYKKGELKNASDTSVSSQYDASSVGMGRGRGMGRGMGRRRGMRY
jgi:predicted Fe-Mo cluster-binding NifX family protein